MDSHILKEIITFADHAHGDQQRKYSKERYIVHPIRVMQTVQQYTNDLPVLAAALLHDVLEDTPVTLEEIRLFLKQHMSASDTERTLDLVRDLTAIYTKKAFSRMNRRTRKQKEFDRLSRAKSEAQTIKYADVMDNVVDIMTHDPDFGRVFLTEAELLLAKIDRGNPVLYQRAKQTLKQCLERSDRAPDGRK